MSADLVRTWLANGVLDLPLPGAGATGRRWTRLAELTAIDVVSGRLAEAHVDAVAILAELDGPAPRPDQLWGVWAAEAPEAVLRVNRHGDTVTLTGAKAWCSGATICTHALVTARLPDDTRALFAVELGHPAVEPEPSVWRNCGMKGSDTRSMRFTDVPAIPVGSPGDYLTRPGFWHGAAGVAACWLGGAKAVTGPLYRAGGERSANPHVLAHLGAVDAAIAAAEALLMAAAQRVDDDPADDAHEAEMLARRARAAVETAVEEAIRRTGRALGPARLAHDGRHARDVADLMMYVRQSHAECDLAALGRLAGAVR